MTIVSITNVSITNVSATNVSIGLSGMIINVSLFCANKRFTAAVKKTMIKVVIKILYVFVVCKN